MPNTIRLMVSLIDCEKSVSILSYSAPYFSGIRTEYGEVLRISPYSVLMQENTYQNNSEYGLFRAVIVTGMTTKTQNFCLLTYEPISFRSYGKFGIITSLYQQLANLKTIF